jgi:hypothetical protein
VNLDPVRRIADAVLYEGYLLYPYRASAVKNRLRWQFGVVMPPGYAAADPSERSYTQAECLVEGGEAATITVALRFLQVVQRSVQRWTGDRYTPVEVLQVDGAPLTAWQEGVEREILVAVPALPHEHPFRIDAAVRTEPVRDGRGRLIGRVVRRHATLCGAVTVASRPEPGPWRARRLRVRVENRTPLPHAGDRAQALPAALVACHTVIGLAGAAFVSMMDPPEWAAGAVAGCVNEGTWPVLAGPPGRRETMLCAPIILYDHPEIAPESPGDLFDATEIDELLTLRTLTLSAAEKRAARATDPRAAALIDRTEALGAAQLRRLHGAARGPRRPEPAASSPAPPAERPAPPPGPGAPGAPTGAPADPGAAATVVVAGRAVRAGSRVRLRPGSRRSDAQDMFLTGRVAVVEAVLRDVDDHPYLAVTLVDDPAAEVCRSHGRFRYFAPDEVEPAVD